MTELILFIFESINKVFDLMSSFKFNLFGFDVNLLQLSLTFLLVSTFIYFLRLGISFTTQEVVTESINHRLKVNKEIKKAREEKRSKSYSRNVEGGRWI